MVCGRGPLQPVEQPITVKRRSKFGAGWIIFAVLTCGIGAVLFWLAAPRVNETVSVDRYLVCGACGSRQP